ncbi:MAG TPA: GNAT family N-acetyltransferase [Mycobacteriales bacterium]|nr:GNAT family N-acetyltransferase [Mycobacteriales bacterium]
MAPAPLRAVGEALITVRPANEASWEDLVAIFSGRGPGSRCWCQREKLARGEAFKHHPAEVRADRLREQTDCGGPGPTTGLVAYSDGEPVGWCAVEPRAAYEGMARNSSKAAWVGRDEDRTDPGVWAVTCFLVRAPHRREGVATALAAAAVDHARKQGARALEAYPMTTTKTALLEELHVGTLGLFTAAGFTEVVRPSLRRAVVRIDF